MPEQEADEYVVSDPELITQVRNGDREAFGELYRRHSGPATNLARQFARNAAEADDLVSESFARVLDNLLDGKGPDTAFRAYRSPPSATPPTTAPARTSGCSSPTT